MNELKSEFVKSHYVGAKIIVDGEDLRDLLPGAKFTYLTPKELYESMTNHPNYEDYANIPDEDGKTIIFSCICGQVECGCVFMDLIEKEEEVIWENFENSYGLSYNLGPFKFSKTNYQEFLLDLLQPY